MACAAIVVAGPPAVVAAAALDAKVVDGPHHLREVVTRRWRPSSSQALLLVGDCRLLLVVESIVDLTYAACFLIPACVPSWAAPVLLALLVGDCRLLLVVHVHPRLLVVLFPDSLLSCSSRPPPRGVPSCGVSSAPGPLFGDDMTPLHHAGCVREGADDDDDASLVDDNDFLTLVAPVVPRSRVG